MLSREDNDRLTRVGPGTPMGELMRRYWIPAGFAHHVAKPDDPPVRVKLMGETARHVPRHARAASVCSTSAARTAPRRCSSAATKSAASAASITAGSSTSTATASTCRASRATTICRRSVKAKAYPCVERGGLVWAYMGPRRAQARISRSRMDADARSRIATPPATSRNATGCRGSKAASIPATSPSCTAARRIAKCAWSRRATRSCRPTSASSPAPAATWATDGVVLDRQRDADAVPQDHRLEPDGGACLGADRRREHDALQRRLQRRAAADRRRPRALDERATASTPRTSRAPTAPSRTRTTTI